MAELLTVEERALLGLDTDVVVGESMMFPRVESVAAYGLAQGNLDLASLAREGSTEFALAGVPNLEENGLRLEVLLPASRVARISSIDGEPLTLCGNATRSDAGVVAPDDPATVVLDLYCAVPGGVLLPDRSGVLLLRRETLRLVLLHGSVARPDPLAEISPPLEEWAAHCPDEWGRSVMGRLAALGNSWSRAVAAGICARLVRWNVAEGSTLRNGKLLPNEPLARSRRWAAGLARDQVATLSDLAIAYTEQLSDSLLRLSEGDVDPRNATWRARVLDTLMMRDDLECVRILLAEARSSETLDHLLSTVDRQGRSSIDGLPPLPGLADERLRRAREIDPAAWWTRPVDDALAALGD